MIIASLAGFLWLTGFNIDNAIVPQHEILSGGPPKDGIPAILAPGFLKPNQATFLKDSDQVIGVQIGATAKAYLLDWLRNNPGILNDRLGNMPVQIEVNSAGEVVAVRDKTGNPISSTFAYWFAWQAFYPETEVFQK